MVSLFFVAYQINKKLINTRVPDPHRKYNVYFTDRHRFTLDKNKVQGWLEPIVPNVLRTRVIYIWTLTYPSASFLFQLSRLEGQLIEPLLKGWTAVQLLAKRERAKMAQVANKLLFTVLLLLVPFSDGFGSSRRYGGSYRFGTLHTIFGKIASRSPQIQSRFKASFLCTLIYHRLPQSMYVIKNVLEMFWHGSKPITGYDHTFTRQGTSWVWAHMRNLVWPGRGNYTFLCNLLFSCIARKYGLEI